MGSATLEGTTVIAPTCSQRAATRGLARRLAALLIAGLCAAVFSADAALADQVIVVVGAAGTPEYGEQFAEWADRWKAAAEQAKAQYLEIGRSENAKSDKEQLQQALATIAQQEPNDASGRIWLVLIGHGTSLRDISKFNLRGPDVSLGDFQTWLKPISSPLAIINCSSASGGFLSGLSGPGRIVITATKSGSEQNFARFGKFLSLALTDPASDLDHDDQVSLLEAYLSASRRVSQFYEQESRLATEHSLLDDNGDKRGTPASFFKGIYVVQKAQDGADTDGQRAHQWHLDPGRQAVSLAADQQAERDKLEDEIHRLRSQRARLTEDEYYEQLEPLLIQIAQLYADAED